jgi:hypothetical protein
MTNLLTARSTFYLPSSLLSGNCRFNKDMGGRANNN